MPFFFSSIKGNGISLRNGFIAISPSDLVPNPERVLSLIVRGVAKAQPLAMEDGMIGSFGSSDGCAVFTFPSKPD